MVGKSQQLLLLPLLLRPLVPPSAIRLGALLRHHVLRPLVPVSPFRLHHVAHLFLRLVSPFRLHRALVGPFHLQVDVLEQVVHVLAAVVHVQAAADLVDHVQAALQVVDSPVLDQVVLADLAVGPVALQAGVEVALQDEVSARPSVERSDVVATWKSSSQHNSPPTRLQRRRCPKGRSSLSEARLLVIWAPS